MADDSISQSQEGFQWTKKHGLHHQGLPSFAVVKSTSNLISDDKLYDCIVIGAGYAGLTAARDLTLTGHRTLLLEARDRIGGRTWTAAIDGHNFEIGGTYIHWAQLNVWREIARYGMQTDVDTAVDLEKGVTEITMTSREQSKSLSQAEQNAILGSAIKKYMDIDQMNGQAIMPFPHAPFTNPEAARLDEFTLADRLNQVRENLTQDELTLLTAILATLCGTRLEDAGLFDFVRLWALCGYSADGVVAITSLFKFHDGQSAFARKFWDEAIGTGLLSYSFKSSVWSVSDDGQCVDVSSSTGRTFKGRKVVCTIPHNVLPSIKFDPPLKDIQAEVLKAPHVNQSTKIHAEVQPTELRTWIGINSSDNKLIQAAGEAITPAGNARLVCFGADNNPLAAPLESGVDEILFALASMAKDKRFDIERLVFHDWRTDKFSQGGWSYSPPGMATKPNLATLREGHGNVWFSNADWAAGWRGFIDGAIEEGTRVAKNVSEELRTSDVLR